ncbi:hypothetical protein BGZ73_003709 [Actinomortierella ambigua]|nr:hypothetical protein BGZ73_003709 [Actinomortierella ambigua]
MSDDSFWRNVVVSSISAIRLAVEDVNKAKILPLNISLSMRSSQPPPGSVGQDGSSAMMSSAQFVSQNVSALIGDTISWLTAFSASLTSALHIPQCTFSSISDDLSSKVMYGHLFRTTPAGKIIADVFLQYIQAMGWRRIGILYTSDAFGVSLASEINHRTKSYGIRTVYWEVMYLASAPPNAMERTMQNLRDMGSYVNIVLTTDSKLLKTLEDIQKNDMFKLPNVWITLNNISRDITTYFSAHGRPSPSNFNGLIMLDQVFDLSGDAEYDKFYDRWQNLDPNYYPGGGPGTELNYFQGRAYSCVQMLALGYQKDIQRVKNLGYNDSRILELLKSGAYPREVGNLTAAHFSTVEYHGPAGEIKLNKLGDPNSGPWAFYQLQNNKAVEVGRSVPFNNTVFNTIIRKDLHYWPGLGSTTPTDAPNWVLQNLRWSEPIARVFAILATMGISLAFIIMGIIIWKRKDPVIKASSPYFCVLEIIGIILAYFVVPLRTGLTRVSSCISMPIIIVLGSTLLLGSLIVKNLRIYRIFSNVFYNKYAIRNSLLARQMAVIVTICMLPPILYVIVASPEPTYASISSNKTAILCLPGNNDMGEEVQTIFMVFMLLPNFVLLMIAGFLAYSTQNVAANWNEAKAMAYTIYNIVFSSLICIPTMFFPDDLYRASVLIQDTMILFASTVSLFVLYGPRLMLMRRRALRARKQSGSTGSGNHQSSFSQSQSGSGSGSGNGNTGRKDDRRPSAVDRDFCRSHRTKEPMSASCPHTTSGFQPQPQPLPVISRQPMDDRDPLESPRFGLKLSFGTGSGVSASGMDRDRVSSYPAPLTPTGDGNGGGDGMPKPPFERTGSAPYLSDHEGQSPTAGSPFTSVSPTDYFQHPRAAQAALEPVDPLCPNSQLVQLSHLASPATLNAGIGEVQHFDAIRFRTGVLGHRHSPNHHHSFSPDLPQQDDQYDLHGPDGENSVDRRHLHNVAMMIGNQLTAGTIPVLVVKARSLVSHVTSRWRAMRVIVVSSLGMVMLIDPKKVKTETFLYIDATAVTQHRHFFLHVTCEHGYELRLEYPCAQARDQWLRSFTTMGTIHDSNQLNPLRHRHNAAGSSNVSNNNSDVAINQPQLQTQQEQQQPSLRPSPMYSSGATASHSSEISSSTPRGARSPMILSSVLELAEFGRTREHRDSNGSETPFYAQDVAPAGSAFSEQRDAQP